MIGIIIAENDMKKEGDEEKKGSAANLQPKAQTLKFNSIMKMQLKTRPATLNPSLTASHVGLGSPSSQV